MLIGDRDRYLRLYLNELVLHVQNHLLEHLLRIFGLVDQIVEIGANQRRNTFHESHDFLQSSPRLFHREFWLIRRRCDCRFV